MNYVTNTFLLVISSVRSKQLYCVLCTVKAKKRAKNTTKNFDEFRSHSPLLTMGERAKGNNKRVNVSGT